MLISPKGIHTIWDRQWRAIVQTLYSPGAVQEGVQRISLILRYLRGFSTLQKRVRLVHEQQQPLPASLRPLEEFVNFSDSIPPERGDVTARQYRELQPGVLRETLREHRLARAGGTVQ